MRVRVLLTALLAFLFSNMSHDIFAQKYNTLPKGLIHFEHYTVESGLSNTIISSILQDKLGYLWFGTYSGLERYDGIKFKSYKHSPEDTSSITNGFVQCLLEDSRGNLWIGTTNGLDKMDRVTNEFKHYFPYKNISPLEWNKNNILSLSEDDEGFIWLGTGDGLNRLNPTKETFTQFRHNPADTNSLRHNVIFAILKDRNGELWIGTGNGLDRFDPATAKFIHHWRDSNHREGFYRDWIKSRYWITALYEDVNGLLWIGTQNGLLELNADRDNYVLYEYKPGSSASISFYGVTSIHHENDDALWIGTWNGLNYFDKKLKVFSHFFHNSKVSTSISQNSISEIFRERSGTLWVATYGGGLNKVNRTSYPFRQYSLQTWQEIPRFSSASINDLSNSANGTLWVATPTGLLNFNPSTEEIHQCKLKQNIRKVYEDKKGNLWIAINSSSGRGIIKIEKSGQMIPIKDSLGTEFPYLVNDIIEYDDSTIWLCTEDIGAIAKINTISNKFSIVIKINTTLNAIYKDTDGLLLIGTREAGLLFFNPFKNKIKSHIRSAPEGTQNLSGNTILDIHGDNGNVIWLGTNIGINSFNKITQKFESITERDGLPHNWVYKIFNDDNGNLWLNTLKGISKFILSSKTIKTYDVLEGIVSADRPGVGCQMDDGNIFLVSPAGLIKFNPDGVIDNPFVPPIEITDVRSGDKVFNNYDEVIVSHDEANLAFEFAALSYVRSEKNLYAYKMEGIDKNWIHAGTSRNVTYSNLDPGEYIFRVKGSNNDGVWNEQGTALRIIILPPWWKTKWAYFIYFALIACIVYLTWRLQLKRIRTQHAFEMSRFETQKLHEIDKIKSRFFTNISHEFRTPLTLILGPAKRILERANDSEAKSDADLIHRSAKKLNRLVDELLDISKIEAGEMKLKACPMNLVEAVREITLSFYSLAERKKITFNVTSDVDNIIAYIDKDKFEKILSNILSNAFKFTPEGGTVYVTIRPTPRPSHGRDNTPLKVPSYGGDLGVGLKNQFAEIIIRDTGIGIPQNEKDKIFDRFYQVDGTHTRDHEGTGIGLSLTKELVELHKGKIEVESEEGKGSTFRVFFPLGKSHLKKEEICEDVKCKMKDKDEDKDRDKDEDELSILLKNRVQKADFAFEHFEVETLPSLLIVEDNPDVRKYVRMILEDYYAISEAVDGEDGLQKSLNSMPDLIITDIMMPRMDGIQLCKQLKTDSRTSHVPIIMLTAKATLQDKVSGLEIGADDYIMKPFEPEELKARIKNLLEQRKRLHQHFQKFGFAKVDERAISSLDKEFIQRAVKIINEHISDTSFGVESLAENMAVGRSLLLKKMEALIGEAPVDLIKRVRLNKAAELIESHSFNVSEVALEVGFNNPSYFAKCFKKQFGVSPSKYHSKS
jgi:signal transduction histidine kinase/ligand-binding sensor domain-containing protein/DNA-binding NarL/FixJ family response regulator